MDKYNKEIVVFAATVEGPITQELKECNKNFHKNNDNMFAFPTNLTEVFNTVGNLKYTKGVGTEGVSAEVLKTSFLVIILLN